MCPICSKKSFKVKSNHFLSGEFFFLNYGVRLIEPEHIMRKFLNSENLLSSSRKFCTIVKSEFSLQENESFWPGPVIEFIKP